MRTASAKLRSRSWICGYAEASSDTATAIEDLLTDIRRSLPRPSFLKRTASRIQGVSATVGAVGFGFNLRDAQGDTSYERLLELLSRLVKLSIREGTGLAIFLDEVQVLPDSDLHKIIKAQREIGHTFPIATIFSGLPSLTHLGAPDWRALSSPPMHYYLLEPLTPDEAKDALTNPLMSTGGSIQRIPWTSN